MGPDDSVGRLFVAVAFSDEVRHGLATHLIDAVEGSLPGRPVPPDNWHITLRFLGETSQRELEMLLYGLASGLSIFPFVLGFGGLGAFPKPTKATVLWLDVERGRDQLVELAGVAEAAALRAGFGPQERPFHPHLTLARIRPHEDVAATVESVERFPLTQLVDEVAVYRSHLGGGPARYEVLETVELRS